MTVMINGKHNDKFDGIAVGDVDTYKTLIAGVEFANTGKKPEKEKTPIRKAMLEQFGYVSKTLLDKVVI